MCWHDRRFDLPINNNKRFIQAGLRIFDHLAQLTTGKLTNTDIRLNLSNTLAMLMRKASRYSFIGHGIKQRQRTEGYISYIRRKFDVDLDYYDHKQWFQKAVAKEKLSLFWKPGADTSDWYQFQLAVRQWQKLVSQHEVFHQALTLEL